MFGNASATTCAAAAQISLACGVGWRGSWMSRGSRPGSELEALFLESRLIKRYLPEANLLQRNDRDYPFIRVDAADPFPRLETTRQPPSGGDVLLGPFRRSGTVSAHG